MPGAPHYLIKGIKQLGLIAMLCAALALIDLNSSVIAQVSTTTPTAAPPQPAGLYAAPGSCETGRINISWPAVAEATGYRLYRDARQIFDGSNLTYADSGLPNGAQYKYNLFAYNSLGVSPSTTVQTMAPPLCTAGTSSIPSSANLLANGSLEASSGNAPTGWYSTTYKSPSATFSYPAAGNAATKGMTVAQPYDVPLGGDAHWEPTSQFPVTAGAKYTFSDWYNSNAQSEVDVYYITPDGASSYYILSYVPSSGGMWKQFAVTFLVPSAWAKIAPFHLLAKQGTLTVDDLSLVAGSYAPAPPTIDFSSSPSTIAAGQSSTLTWSSKNAGTCAASGGWTGTQSVSGTKSVSPASTTFYSLLCIGAGGSVSQQTVVTVSANASPAPPTNFSLNGAAQSQAVPLKWTNGSSHQDKFNIDRAISGSGNYANLIQLTPGTATGYLDDTVVAGATYDYRIQACLSGTGCSAYATLSGIAVPQAAISGQVPAPPASLHTAAAPSASSVPLAWTNGSLPQDSVVVERKLHADASFTVSSTLTGSSTSYIDTYQLSPGGVYDYRVKACASNYGCSDYAALSSIAIPAARDTVSVPAAPTDLAASPSAAGYVSLQWRAGSSNQDKFRIERKIYGAATFSVLDVVADPSAAAYTDLNAAPGATYVYGVAACLTGYGCSADALSPPVTVPAADSSSTTSGNTDATTTMSTSTATDQTPALAVPPRVSYVGTIASTCSLSATRLTIVLNWQAANTATSYVVHRNGAYLGETAGVSYSDDTAARGTTYSYAIYAKNAAGLSSPFTVNVIAPSPCAAAATTTAQTAPLAPGSLQQTSGAAGTIALAWQGVSSAKAYVIERRLSSDVSFAQLTYLSTQGQVSYVDSSVSSGVFYDYRVKACATSALCSDPVYLYRVAAAPAKPSEAPLAPIASATPALAPAPSPAPAPSAPSPAPSNPQPADDSISPAQQVASMESIDSTIGAAQGAIDATKADLAGVIDAHIAAVRQAETPANASSTESKLADIRSQMTGMIDSYLSGLAAVTPQQLSELKSRMQEGLRKIDALAPKSQPAFAQTATTSLSAVLGSLSAALETQQKALAASGGDLVFKDSNGDGISDYDSINIYHLDPSKPSPVTVIDGQKMNAGQKVLAGYDPARSAPVKVEPQEPEMSMAPVTNVHKVAAVSLTPDKKVEIKGRALPNSFVTLYIYSTPIVVTVKADANGEWEYTMDRELDSGAHTLYAATVNDTGHIIAKSAAIPFTKTAEAATLDTVPPLGVSNPEKPTLWSNWAVTPLVVFSIILMFVLVFMIGRTSKTAVPAAYEPTRAAAPGLVPPRANPLPPPRMYTPPPPASAPPAPQRPPAAPEPPAQAQ